MKKTIFLPWEGVLALNGVKYIRTDFIYANENPVYCVLHNIKRKYHSSFTAQYYDTAVECMEETDNRLIADGHILVSSQEQAEKLRILL
jgi:hypothetical protein